MVSFINSALLFSLKNIWLNIAELENLKSDQSGVNFLAYRRFTRIFLVVPGVSVLCALILMSSFMFNNKMTKMYIMVY